MHERQGLNIANLPWELVLRIFKLLSPDETLFLIKQLHECAIWSQGNHTKGRDEYDTLLEICYKRLYEGRILITTDPANQARVDYDSVLSIGEFCQKFKDTGELESKVFKTTRPRELQFVFVRDCHDYSQFIEELKEFNYILEKLNVEDDITRYIDETCQISLFIDGNTLMIESPTGILVAVLKTLILAADGQTLLKDVLVRKFTNITIKSTDIGKHYLPLWGRLLERFSNVVTLDLTDNLITSDLILTNEGHTSLKVDSLANEISWPKNLKCLILDKNNLSYISSNFISNLPRNTVEHLSFSANSLVTLGQNHGESFNIPQDLPKLRSLCLKDNNSLRFINSNIFDNVKIAGQFKILDIRGCNIDEECIRSLRRKSDNENFHVLF
ncbi:Piso0_005118 [Millerozyma farinosa CBS 7064]|uniref:Piso0_005118 protein n=1 Tax=Pichia sorbitophila (strain ATCC MYA-4447 / BCRC 22081 / CBS 7064 / NBRC 10061 / NRRL Y-12695) TaxID=559304 RepID=G8Y1B5_PICSO|nr:Piso0_005118 [Millerozyma farinosa CBS 7064]